MKLISEQYNLLSEFIPGHIARYQDDYEPRAFGDSFTKSGASIVLIESGGWCDDREKEFLRKINFISLLTSFKGIAEESYLTEKIETYQSVPINEKLMMDFIIRNVSVRKFHTKYVMDIGINYEEINFNNNHSFYYKAKIEDIGDLSVYHGYKELDATGMILVLGKTFETEFNSVNEIQSAELFSLLQKGITNLKLSNGIIENQYSPVMFNIILNNKERIEELKKEAVPNFILYESGKLKYAIINGFIVKPDNVGRIEGNALIFR